MELSTSGIIAFNLFGITLVGPDICGFSGDTTNELCSRWMAVGSFYPFMRNHNTAGATPQDPPSLGEPVISISRYYLNIRYTFLPYLYTQFYKANTQGTMVARGLFTEFYYDKNTRNITTTQFMFGPGVLVSPALQQGQVYVNAYFPINNRWYNIFGLNELPNNGYNKLYAPYSTNTNEQSLQNILPVYIRGGYIFVLQNPITNNNTALTTVEQAPNPYQLLMAVDMNGTANGDVFIDDGNNVNSIIDNEYTFIDFSLTNDNQNTFQLKNNIVNNGFKNLTNKGIIDYITVAGLNSKVNFNSLSMVKITQNGQSINGYKTDYNSTSGVLKIDQLNMYINEPFVVSIVKSS